MTPSMKLGRFRTWIEVLKLRLELSHCSSLMPIKVRIVKKGRWWHYMNEVQTHDSIQRRDLGTIYQYDGAEEAYRFAMQQAGEIITPQPQLPPIGWEAPPKPRHVRTYVLGPPIQVACQCGWRATTLRCHPEVENNPCPQCQRAEAEFDEHFKDHIQQYTCIRCGKLQFECACNQPRLAGPYRTRAEVKGAPECQEASKPVPEVQQ